MELPETLDLSLSSPYLSPMTANGTNLRSSCTLRGLQCENGLQYANFRVKCIFVVITRNTITSAKQHLQRLKRSNLKAIKALLTFHRFQLGSRLVSCAKLHPSVFQTTNFQARFTSKIQIDFKAIRVKLLQNLHDL